MNSLFNEILEAAFTGVAAGSGSLLVNLRETEEAFELLAEVPGLTAEEVTITYEDSYLSIVAGKRAEEKWDYNELRNYPRSRKMYMPQVSPESIEASVENGLLRVSAPKKAKDKTMVAIKVK